LKDARLQFKSCQSLLYPYKAQVEYRGAKEKELEKAAESPAGADGISELLKVAK